MEIHDENKKEYASKSLAGTALEFGIGGAALALLNGGLGNLFGTKSTVSMPENVNINGGINTNAENLIALERERRQCADNKIVNYVNSTFYPVSIADVTTGTTTTKASTYNPLCGCTCIR